jgi:Pyruvate/2-oxoacid:ferredoxin oxidoreductase gamma subunit
VERELMLTGIGGQGVQLAAQVIARAAVLEGRQAMLFGVYSVMMRGGNSDSTVVVADGPVQAPPLLSHTWSALVMHHEFWEPMKAKIKRDGVVLLNSSLFEGELDRDAYRVFDVPVTDLAASLGNPLGASMVMTGAYAAITGLIGLDAAVEAMTQSLPSYRQQHIEGNRIALHAGFDAAGEQRLAAPAWQPDAIVTGVMS